MKNFFFIIIDALRLDAVSDAKFKLIAPTLFSLSKKGIVNKIIANGQVTKFVVPSIFTQTYPLDYGGYNYGIKNRPSSFIELVSKQGFHCKMYEGHDIDGPFGLCERGFHEKFVYYDKRLLLEGYVKKKILHDIDQWKKKKITKEKLIEIIQNELGEILEYIKIQPRVNHSFYEQRLGKLTKKEMILIDNEISLIKNDPDEILKKLSFINPYFYFDYLGLKLTKSVSLSFRIRNKLFSYKKRAQSKINKILNMEINFVPSRPRITTSCRRIFSDAFHNLKNKKQFIYIHFMDLHDHNIYNNLIFIFRKLRFFPRVILSRFLFRKEYKRKFSYDLALSSVDYELSIFIENLKKKKSDDKSLFFIIGDHGDGWNVQRNSKLRKDFGFRTYNENINIPLIISPFKKYKKEVKNLFDSMSVSATILEILGIKPHNSYKGISVFSKGKKIIITENCGRGNADILTKDIYFTLTSLKYKLFCKLKKKELILIRLYNLESDPNELINIIKTVPKSNLNNFIEYLYKERKELFKIKGINEKIKLGNNMVKIFPDHMDN